MTDIERINEMERQVIRLTSNPDNVCGGLKAWESGRTTYLKPRIQQRVDKLEKEIRTLTDKIADRLGIE